MRALRLLTLSLCALAGLPAAAQETLDRDALEVSGYLQPQLGATVRPSALPRDQWQLGVRQSRAGLILTGSPVDRWGYDVHVVLTGNTDELLIIEDASVRYQATDDLRLKAGQMRVPFTVQHQSPNTALMFPTRSEPNNAFLSGIDLGLLASTGAPGDSFTLSGGVFNGGGLQTGSFQTGATHRGAVFALRADVNPLGRFAPGESDHERSDLRLGFGAGVLLQPSLRYDESGFQDARETDLRLTASARAAFRGFYAQTEGFHRRRTYSLRARPDIATGAYLQTAYFFGRVEPVARLGFTLEDQGFDPRFTQYQEAGFNLYLGPRSKPVDALKATIVYFGEIRRTERENAHGGLVQLQMRF